MKIKNINNQVRFILGSVLLTTVVGCSTSSNVITSEERAQRARLDIANMFKGQEPITGPITIGEAMARSLSYNLDHRLKQMESAVASGQYNLSRFGMLPKLVAKAGYSERDNDPGARSINLETGEESLPPSSSAERETETSSLAFSWNVLDFGLSYYSAKQGSDQVKIAEERRRKTIQNISQDVIDAFWKAWMSQSLEPKVNALLAETREALAESRGLAERRVQNSNDSLRNQAAMLSSINTLLEMRERINLSKTRLGALMNVKPGVDFQVAVPPTLDIPQTIQQGTSQLLQLALSNRPELREEDYKKRISELDVKKTFLKIFPDLNFTTGHYRDENTFLVNNSWKNVGRNISWDLFGALNSVSENNLNKAKVQLADVRRQALSMAVMTQVYLSISRYELARSRYSAATELYEVRSSLAKNSEATGSRESGTRVLEARSAAIASELRRSLAFSSTQTAFARVVNSIGIDSVPMTVDSYNLKSLTAEFDKRWNSITSGSLVDIVSVEPSIGGMDSYNYSLNNAKGENISIPVASQKELEVAELELVNYAPVPDVPAIVSESKKLRASDKSVSLKKTQKKVKPKDYEALKERPLVGNPKPKSESVIPVNKEFSLYQVPPTFQVSYMSGSLDGYMKGI